VAESTARDQVEAGANPAPEDELRPVTSLFADVVGSTGLGERLLPSEVKAVIGECVSRMCEVVEGYGGHVRSYMGDGIAAFFGIDVTREDDPDRASRAALEILQTIAGYADEVRAAWGVDELNVRVGLNCGRVAVGEVGAREPLIVALGDSVNVAARLQSAAKPGTILLGASVARVVSDRFVLQPVGKVPIRGRTSEVDAFELRSEEEPGRVPTFSAAFVGRDHEVGLIDGMLTELRTGRGQVCLLVGDGGLGKTRLMSEVRVRAGSDIVWLDGWCDPMDQRLPYEPFVQSLRSWLGLGARSSSIETRVRLKARVSDLLGERFDDCAPHLARLLGVELGPPLDRRFEGMPGDVLRAGLTRSYIAWLTAVAERSPVVLALDNFGSISEPGSELAASILDALERAPILLLVSLRPERRTPGWEIRVRALADFAYRSKEIRLAPLAASESHVVLDSLDVNDTLDSRLREVVVTRAEGNPLFLEELFSAVATDVITEEALADHLPGALQSLLLSKIDALPPDARATLQAAAVLGRSFMKDVVERVSAVRDLDGCLATLLRADVIRERGRDPAGYVFRHGLIREAALSTLTPVRYRLLNRAAAVAMEAWELFDAERDAESLAGHYFACGDLEQAIDCLERYGDRLAALCRFEEAIGVYGRCLREVDGIAPDSRYVRVARKKSQVTALQGDPDEAVHILEVASARATPPERLEILLTKAREFADMGRIAEAESVLGNCSTEVGIEESKAYLLLRGRVAFERQDLEEAERRLAQLGDFSSLGPELGFEAASLRAGILATVGDLDGAEMLALQAQTFADQLGRTTDQLTARRHVALICLLKGCVREAYELTLSVYQRYAQLGFRAGQLEAGINLLHVSHFVGELEVASRVAAEAAALAPSPLLRSLVLANWSVIEYERNNLDEALTLASETIELCREIEIWPAVTAHLTTACVAIARDDALGAMSELKAAEVLASRAGRDVERALLKSCLAAATAKTGDVVGAVALAREALHTEVALDRVTKTQLQRSYGELVSQFDRPEGARVLAETLVNTQQMGLRLEEGRVLVALGSLDDERSSEYFAEAEQIFRECGCHRGLAELGEARASRDSAPSPIPS
jgi:class 3 adenylate cyclase/tetratricopeptide (TPR) repeat protein